MTKKLQKSLLDGGGYFLFYIHEIDMRREI